MGLVSPGGELEHYNGVLRFVDSRGAIVADKLDVLNYQDYIGEAVEPFSYLKSPYYKRLGYPDGIYRVGPLARLNIIDRCGTPLADQEWAEFQGVGPRHGAEFFLLPLRSASGSAVRDRAHGATLERPGNPLEARARLRRTNNKEGIGVAEAPRGTLIHHYKIDDNGLIIWANLIIATGHNNLALNRGVFQVAKHFVNGAKLSEGMLNRVEAVVRAFDPCLSCSTHALGHMALQVQLVAADGMILDEIRRN